MSIVATFLRLATQVFLNLAVALILFVLPAEVLFRLSSWSLIMPAPDIVMEVAMMILLLALVSASLALLMAGLGCLSLSFRKVAERIEETLCAVAAVAALAIIAIFLLKMLKNWLELATGIYFSMGAARTIFPLLVIGILGVWAWKHGFLAAGISIRPSLAKGNKAVLILIVSAGMLVVSKGIVLHDYHDIKPNLISPPKAGMANVILLSIDALTAEDMSMYGYHLPTTPKLEAFARESYVFDNFFSSSNWTTPSVASFISGLYPVTNGVHHVNSYFLEHDKKKNLAQALKDNGYLTAAIVTNERGHPLDLRISDSFSATTEPPIRNISALHPIFVELFRLTEYRTYWWLRDLLDEVSQGLFLYRDQGSSLWPPELAFDRTLPFLNTLKQPTFVWTHILPPHNPYLPAAPFKYEFGNFKEFATEKHFNAYGAKYSPEQQVDIDRIRLRYDEFILDTDSRIGIFLEKLRALGRFDDSIIIITADHGESFSRNHLYHGGRYLHQPLIHVPLIVHLPGQKEGKRIPFYAGQVDLLPTVMDLLDLPISNWAEGESLKGAMLEGKLTSLPKFSMNMDRDSRFAPPNKGTVAVMKDGWKLVRYLATGEEELYHLASDPRETADVATSNPEQAKKMRALIYARFKLGT